MLRATCFLEQKFVILLLPVYQTFAALAGHNFSKSLHPANPVNIGCARRLNFCQGWSSLHWRVWQAEVLVQKGCVWKMNRKTSPRKALNIRQPGFGFLSCRWVIFLRLIREQRLRGCPLSSDKHELLLEGFLQLGHGLPPLLSKSDCPQAAAFPCLKPTFCLAVPFPKAHRNMESLRVIGTSLQVW